MPPLPLGPLGPFRSSGPALVVVVGEVDAADDGDRDTAAVLDDVRVALSAAVTVRVRLLEREVDASAVEDREVEGVVVMVRVNVEEKDTERELVDDRDGEAVGEKERDGEREVVAVEDGVRDFVAVNDGDTPDGDADAVYELHTRSTSADGQGRTRWISRTTTPDNSTKSASGSTQSGMRL